MTQLQRRIEEALESRFGLGDIKGFVRREVRPEFQMEGASDLKLSNSSNNNTETNAQDSFEQETATVTANAVMQRMTNAEKRLVLSAYLASHIPKEEDIQHFLPERLSRGRRAPG